ncbi:DNA polymerase-3 subunit epsilon [Bizionia echini]|uniref:Excinuclease cho n=2 Tax=Bizionia echini TaxID=649333 RepID=A0A1I5BY41_9FLAO|nr:DNA polymerase-3 subunit epsilon [Bizionia echini]
MLQTAPKFYEVAKRIVEMTDDCIIVAHNSQFDYRILKTEFNRLGFPFKRKTLCTVELSKKLIPGQDSYSLGKLARSLGIPVSDRHRANGDAMATVKLFKMLLSKDLEKVIVKDAIQVEAKKEISANLKNIIKELPHITGVYYIHNAEGAIIYIGKSNNIKNRISQHFTNSSTKSKKIQRDAAAVTYEHTGSELVALLKESEEIKRNKPIFNRALRRNIFTHALYSYTDSNGYINLVIEKADGRKKPITTFTNRQSAKSFLFNAVEEFQLCQKLTGLYPTKTSCFNYDIKQCLGACIEAESPESYNKRVLQLIAKNSYNDQNMVIIDRARDVDERSAILIEKGIFKGIGYFNLNYQITNVEVLQSIITPMENNRDAQHIIKSYLRKNKKLKIIKFDN